MVSVMMLLSDVCAALNIVSPHEVELHGVCIDSRHVVPGHLFVAIRGERFDGRQFIADAIQRGAVAVICSEPFLDIDVPQLVVDDTVEALAKIATAYRQKMTCRVIALTGSNGKTSVKEMISAILPKPSYATPGNLNNHIGVPLSVLQLTNEHRYAVFELGANHSGEIAHTVAIVKPDVTLINNIAPAHIEGFGSIDGVAKAKGEIHDGLALNGIAVINDDDDYHHFWDASLTQKNIKRFSAQHSADVYATDITFDAAGCAQFVLVLPTGRASVALNVAGMHNVRNALAAAACTYALDIPLSDIVSGLSHFAGVSGRMTFLQGKNNALVIDDTYNANLRSSLTALDVLAKRQGRRIFVFGDMGELGDWSKLHHEEVGEAARKHGVEVLMTCGIQSEFATKAYGSGATHYSTQEALVQELLGQLDADTTVLVKGSRSSQMEKIVEQLVG